MSAETVEKVALVNMEDYNPNNSPTNRMSESSLLLDTDRTRNGKHNVLRISDDVVVENYEVEPSKYTKSNTKSAPGITDPKERKRCLIASFSILVTELCERMTFYSITANLVLFLTTKLHFETPTANTIVMVFMGTCYFVPLIGGWLADSYSGKFNVIYGSGLIYVIGVFLLVVTAMEYPRLFGHHYYLTLGQKIGYYMSGLFLIAVGSGGIKANVSPYGADQVEKAGPAAIQTFFLWFYWFINLGSFISFLAIAYIQQNISFFIGYTVPLISMILAVMIFQMARSSYVDTVPVGSVMSTFLSAIIEGIRRRKCTTNNPHNSFIDCAKTTHGGTHSVETVEGVKAIAKILPIFVTLIMYWCIYTQMSSLFFTQTLGMDIKIGTFEPPVASLNLFNIIIVLILIPLMDRLVYPLLQRYNRQPTLLQRMGFGYVLAGLAVVVAGILEIYRRRDFFTHGGVQCIGGEPYNSSSISMFLQVPQFALIGASEVFTSIASLEFAYSQSPAVMKGIIMGLSLLMTGLGSYVASIIIIIIQAATYKNPWFPDEINDGHIEYIFFLLGGLMFLNLVIFILLSRWYCYIEDRPLSSRSSSYTSTDISPIDSQGNTPKPSVSDFPSDKNEYTHM